MGMAVVPMIGPAFGGVLDEIFGWQANFWALFILGAMLFALCWRDLGETAPLTGRTLMQQFRDYPALLTSRRFWGYSLAAGLSSGSFFAYLGGAPFVGDQVFGLSPSLLGVLFGAPAIGYFLGNFASGRFSTRFGVNRMVLWGALFNAGGIGINVALFHLGLGSPLVFFGLMTFMGLGNGMVIPNATAGALSIRPDLAGTASGLSGAMMIGFGAALSALAGTMLTPGSGALVLLWIMFATAVAAVITILLVIRRERRLALV
jgi:DHA1 family bicyclomycin/chloramphenicol resistance-like MFS transporter